MDISCQLTCTQIPETALQPISQDSGLTYGEAVRYSPISATDRINQDQRVQQVVLYPGEESELLIQLTNISNETIYFKFDTEDLRVNTDIDVLITDLTRFSTQSFNYLEQLLNDFARKNLRVDLDIDVLITNLIRLSAQLLKSEQLKQLLNKLIEQLLNKRIEQLLIELKLDVLRTELIRLFRQLPNNLKLLELLERLLNKVEQLVEQSLIELKAEIPLGWYELIYPENSQLEPKMTKSAVLRFKIAQDFLESAKYPRLGEAGKLDYQGQIHIGFRLGNIDEARCSAGFKDFSLHIRPRSLYLNFLPEIYREADFVGRWLAIFEQAFEPTFQTFKILHTYLNPLTAPEALLPFIAHWVGWEFIPGMTHGEQREFIHQAIKIYHWRGTRRGLRFCLKLYLKLFYPENVLPEDVLGDRIEILDNVKQGLILGDAKIGEDSTIGFRGKYYFIVRLRTKDIKHRSIKNSGNISEEVVRQIIEREKPFFCTYDLEIA